MISPSVSTVSTNSTRILRYKNAFLTHAFFSEFYWHCLFFVGHVETVETQTGLAHVHGQSRPVEFAVVSTNSTVSTIQSHIVIVVLRAVSTISTVSTQESGIETPYSRTVAPYTDLNRQMAITVKWH